MDAAVHYHNGKTNFVNAHPQQQVRNFHTRIGDRSVLWVLNEAAQDVDTNVPHFEIRTPCPEDKSIGRHQRPLMSAP